MSDTPAPRSQSPIDAHRRVLDEQRRAIDAVLGGLVDPQVPVALVNFPNHRNVGDSAIWLGAEAVLERLGITVRYRATWDACSVQALRARVGDGPILVNGGGNFGDLYQGQQGLRERLLATCRDNPIIQLPQSIWFDDPRNAERVAGLVHDHGRVTILCREQASVTTATSLFDAPVHFCPDLALALTPESVSASIDLSDAAPTATRTERIVWLSRRDGESTHPAPDALGSTGADVDVVDWLEPLPGEPPWPQGAQRAWARNQRLLARMRRGEPATRRWWRPAASTFDPLAWAWLARGVRILSRGDVVVTDRLHAHVVALLLGIPSVVLDNSYGKVHGVVRSSTEASPLTHLADTAEDALAKARALLNEHPDRPTAIDPTAEESRPCASS